MGSQLTWAPGQYMRAGPTVLQNQMRAAALQQLLPERLPCAAHFTDAFISLLRRVSDDGN